MQIINATDMPQTEFLEHQFREQMSKEPIGCVRHARRRNVINKQQLHIGDTISVNEVAALTFKD